MNALRCPAVGLGQARIARALALALAMPLYCAEARAMSPLDDAAALRAVFAMAAIIAISLIASPVIALRRWRRSRRPREWFYLLVPVETALLSAIAISLLDGVSCLHDAGPGMNDAVLIAVPLLAWAVAHLLHLGDASARRGD